MGGYRDEQEAQRMRVVSLEERLAELEAENEELRVREAEAETPLLFGPDSPPSPASPTLTKDVAETLASLKAMGDEIALGHAEKAREAAAEIATASAERDPSVTSTQAPARPLVDLTAEQIWTLERTSVNQAYSRGLKTGVILTLLLVGAIWFLDRY